MPTRKDRPDHLELVGKRTAPPVQPPKLLEHIRNTACESAVQLLGHMFSATDDLFYDLSKRATSNNEQNLYFDSMREIRIQKNGVVTRFDHQFREVFIELLSADAKKSAEPEQGDITALSIVESDKLEVDLALNSMAARTAETYKQELYDLTMRLDHLLLQVRVNDKNNPLAPQQLATAFVKACEHHLDISIKARLILFKLFEKHVLKQLGRIYADANELLKEAGILPKVPRHLSRSPMHTPPRSTEQPQGRQEHTEDTGVPANTITQPAALPAINFQLDLNALSTLMASVRWHTPGGANGEKSRCATGPYTYYLYASNPGPIMDSPQLSALLTRSQPVVDRQLSGKKPRNIIADVINQLLSKRDPELPQALEQPDEDIINLIAMFFDNVLSDHDLPPALQSLICRLQIPILKIALRDSSFLTDIKHPARKLINLITEAGLSFDETKPLERDPLYRKIADGVQTVNRLYKADSSIFSEFLEELQAEINKEVRKSELIEKRTTQSEAGKTKIRNARTAAQNALYLKMRNAQLPEVVGNFLTNTWLQVLIITHLNHGKDSSEWVEVESLVSDIIWLCQPHTDQRSLSRKKRLQPEVMQRLEHGLAAAIDNPETRVAKVTALEEVLQSIEEPDTPHIAFTDLSDEQKNALGKNDPEQKSWEEMTALERQQSRYEQLSNDYYSLAKNISVGVWLEYADETSNRRVRCKLSSKIDADSYLFVNRLGFKVLEKSRRQLAYDLQFDKARIIDNRPLFERLMDKVVTHLKQAS